MKFRILFFVISILPLFSIKAQSDITISIDATARTASLSNGVISMSINSSGYVSSFKLNGYEYVGSGGKFYYDYTDSVSNKAFSPNAVRIQKQTADYGEVVYSRTTGDLILEQGFILRKGVNGFYTYATVKGTATRIRLKEMRMVYRVNPNLFTYGYVTDRMQGQLPSVTDMAAVNGTPVMDATYQLPNGTIYTKYNWTNYILDDSIHGIMSTTNGLWDIPVSHEYVNGGPMKQELTVHTTNTTPLFLQMIQGEHLGAASQYYNNGEQKLYGPFFIYANSGTSYANMIADAKSQVPVQKAQWPFQWFTHDLYPLDRTTVSGNINITQGLCKDSIMVVLAQPNVDVFDQGKGYIFWGLTDKNGDFHIPNVRQGNYSLYAYACKGEVTEQLTINNKTISGSNMTLDTIRWKPLKYQNLLWMIGDNDLRTTGFHYSDTIRQYGLYDLPPANLTYTIGSSTPAKDWYYAQTKAGSWTISFNNTQKYTSGNAVLTASIAGVGNSPSVDVYVNGTKKTTWSFTNDGSVYRSAVLSGRHGLRSLTFTASSLLVGQNTIVLKLSNPGTRGGVMYDCIKLEAGSILTEDRSLLASNGLHLKSYPNPFNNQATISFDLPYQSDIEIDAYNAFGQKVDVIYKGTANAGNSSYTWHPRNLSQGIYFYKVNIGSQVFTGKMLYVGE